MTKEEALKMCLEYIETNAHERRHVRWAIKEALAQPAQEPQVCCGEYDTCLRACTPRGRYLAQPEERNFCPRCGKRTADLTTIHTCTPPVAADPQAFYGFPNGSVSTPNAGGKCVTAGETAPTDATQKAESLRGQ